MMITYYMLLLPGKKVNLSSSYDRVSYVMYVPGIYLYIHNLMRVDKGRKG